MSVPPVAKEEMLNRRELYKIQKLQEINQIYYCECGKNYLTFSALYLHARNKHEVKLTTKRSNQNCRVEQRDQKIIVTYFIQTKQIEPQQSVIQQAEKQELQNTSQKNAEYARMLELLHAYANQEITKTAEKETARKMVTEQFVNYFQQVEELQNQGYPLEPQNITMYFNDFIINYLPLAHQQGFITLNTLGQAENELIKFWRWLREKQHTTTQLLHRTYPAPCINY